MITDFSQSIKISNDSGIIIAVQGDSVGVCKRVFPSKILLTWRTILFSQKDKRFPVVINLGYMYYFAILIEENGIGSRSLFRREFTYSKIPSWAFDQIHRKKSYLRTSDLLFRIIQNRMSSGLYVNSYNSFKYHAVKTCCTTLAFQADVTSL